MNFPFRAQLAHRLRARLGFPLQELALSRLQKAGFRPHVLLDVGASYGIFADEIWALWPDVAVHCFEPEPEYVRQLTARAATDPRLYVCAALIGAEELPAKAYYHFLGASSLFQTNTDNPQKPHAMPGPERTARMTTLDAYCGEHSLTADFLKIDVQGYELRVLQGAEKALNHVEVVLTEVNFIEIYEGAPLVAELTRWLDERQFALHDICEFMRRPLDQALWQCDMIFVKKNSPLRQAKRWR